jgi:hypothetical protein
MVEPNDNRSLAEMKWVQLCQWILIAVCIYFIVRFVQLMIAYDDLGFLMYIVPLTIAALLLIWTSIGMLRRNPRAFFVAMICHLLVTIVAAIGLICFLGIGLFSSVGGHDAAAWSSMFFLFALMWLPFVLISGGVSYYLHKVTEQFR